MSPFTISSHFCTKTFYLSFFLTSKTFYSSNMKRQRSWRFLGKKTAKVGMGSFLSEIYCSILLLMSSLSRIKDAILRCTCCLIIEYPVADLNPEQDILFLENKIN